MEIYAYAGAACAVGMAAWGLIRLSGANRTRKARKEFVRQVAAALYELGLDTEQLPPELRRLYAASCESLFAKLRAPNPNEAACEVFLLAVKDHPHLVPPALRYGSAETRVYAIELVKTWAAGVISRACADDFIKELKSELRWQLVLKTSDEGSRRGESPAAALWS